MTAGATTTAVTASGAVAAARPLVLLDGTLEPDLTVCEFRVQGPLDERDILIESVIGVEEPLHLARARAAERAHAIVVQPLRLCDDTIRWPVLASGGLTGVDLDKGPDRQTHALRLIDQWSKQLTATLEQTWWQLGQQLVARDQTDVRLGPDSRIGQSTQQWTIHGRDTFVLESDGPSWTLDSLLTLLSVHTNMDMSLAQLPTEIANEPIDIHVRLNQPVGDILRSLLLAHGLVLRRDMWWDGKRVVSDLGVCAADQGRVVSIAWPNDQRETAPVLDISTHGAPVVSRAWIAAATPWRIESTFVLQPAWDPALADSGLPDATFSREANPSFTDYTNVFRLWVLNEDGRYGIPPFGLEPFDLTDFFDEPGAGSEAIPFRECLTLDDTGSPRSPVIEVRTSPGGPWAVYPGSASVLNDHAGVYLDDATLPTEVLTAARGATLEIRVTATLTSPLPVRLTRWQGNPFVGSQPPRLLDVAGLFRFARVDDQSRHAAQVSNETLVADQADDTHAMVNWLTRKMRRDRRRSVDRPGRARIRLQGALPLLRVGDRVRNVGGPGHNARGLPEAGHPGTAIVRGIVTRWASPSAGRSSTSRNAYHTELQLEF